MRFKLYPSLHVYGALKEKVTIDSLRRLALLTFFPPKNVYTFNTLYSKIGKTAITAVMCRFKKFHLRFHVIITWIKTVETALLV